MPSAATKIEPVTSPENKISLAEILGALSLALDLTEGQPEGHCMRCCWIGTHVGRELGLSETEIWQLYYTLLLKDIGCSSNAARICQLFLTDDLIFKRNYKTIGTGMPSVLKFVLDHSGLQAPLHKRFSTVIDIVMKTGQYSTELTETRCHAGADIARKLRFPDPVSDGIQSLDEHWNGSGQPQQLKGDQIPVFSRIALLAQVAEVFHTTSDIDGAIREVKARANSWFDPEIVAAFIKVSTAKSFWDGLKSPDIAKKLQSLEPIDSKVNVDDDYLDDIAEAFAQVIDAKSPFTAGHSHRVRLYTDLITAQLQLPESERRCLARAALLHDIGKLAISNSILDKPGELEGNEYEIIQRHPEYSRLILSRVSVFKDIATVAGGHHERPDGKGYPQKLAGDEIDFHTRIVSVADVFDAMTSDRPYWKAKSAEHTLRILHEETGTAFDSTCVAALDAALKNANTAQDTA